MNILKIPDTVSLAISTGLGQLGVAENVYFLLFPVASSLTQIMEGRGVDSTYTLEKPGKAITIT